MPTTNQLRSCLSSLLQRNYFLDKWIGDESLLSILHSQYHLVDVDKKYLNQHLVKICLDSIKIFRDMVGHLRYEQKYARRAYFYYFTKEDTCPVKLSKDAFGDCYFNFRMLRIKNNQINNSNTTDKNRKRKVLGEITNLNEKKQDKPIIVSPIYRNEIENEIAKSIGNYFTAIFS